MLSAPLAPVTTQFGFAASVAPKHEAFWQVKPMGWHERKIGRRIGREKPQVRHGWMADIECHQCQLPSLFDSHPEDPDFGDEPSQTIHVRPPVLAQ